MNLRIRVLFYIITIISVGCHRDKNNRNLPDDGIKTTRLIKKLPIKDGWIILKEDINTGYGILSIETKNKKNIPITCKHLKGAWGLWLTDIDNDNHPEIIITLKKKAKHDPIVENRLHVYSIEENQCVPVWRGTRLSGRFHDIYADPSEGGNLFAYEYVRNNRRIVKYKWYKFGYVLDKVLWQGKPGKLSPPAKLRKMFESLN